MKNSIEFDEMITHKLQSGESEENGDNGTESREERNEGIEEGNRGKHTEIRK